MHTSCNMKCGNLKRRDERKKTLDTRIYPVVRIATKEPLHPRCWSTHEEYHFPAINSLPWTQLQSPWSRFPLRELAHKGGVFAPRTILSTPLHTKPEGRWRASEPPMLQGDRRTEIQVWFTLESKHKAATPFSLTHLGANLALTLSKVC